MADYPKGSKTTIKWEETRLPHLATWTAKNPTTNRSALITKSDILHTRNKYKIQVFQGNRLLFTEFCGSVGEAKKRGKFYLNNANIN